MDNNITYIPKSAVNNINFTVGEKEVVVIAGQRPEYFHGSSGLHG